MHKIDFGFISKLEGGQKLKGYVPDVQNSKSGVTVATGFDIGQRSASDLRKFGFPESLLKKLLPYVGLAKLKAEKKLKEMPLLITKTEANLIDKKVKAQATAAVIKRYDAAIAVDKKTFSQLFAEAQTVIASVSYQYGDLSKRTPTFWRLCTRQEWIKVIAELRGFKDKYNTRRKKEAELLKQGLKRVKVENKSTGVKSSSYWPPNENDQGIWV